MNIVYLNERFLPRNEAMLPIDDRGFLFGDGIFTSIKLHHGNLESYHLHIDRLRSHAAALNIVYPEIKIDNLRELAQLNDALEGTWKMKIVVTGGGSGLRKMSLRPHGHLLITLERYAERSPGLSALISYPQAISCPTTKYKSLSYLSRLCIADYASVHGYDDALVISPEGWILETAFANVFWRMGTNFYTPDPSLPLLAGVSLQAVERCATDLEMSWNYIKCKLSDLPSEAQLFLTNAMIGIRPIDKYQDRIQPRDGVFERALQEIYGIIVSHQAVSLV